MFTLFKRFKALQHVSLNSSDSQFFFNKDTNISFKKSSCIEINAGTFSIGYNLPNNISMPAYKKSNIILGENSKIIINGNVFVGPGSYICVRDNATLSFDGGNYINSNNIIIVDRKVEIGENSSTSWNVTMIDDDGHYFYNQNGKKLKKIFHPLTIGKNCGIQMNVTIPRGVSIGENSIVSAHSIVRENISSNSLIYPDIKLKVKEGFSTGFYLE